MRFFFRKQKPTAPDAVGINWIVVGVTLVATVLLCGLLYYVLAPVFFGDGDQEVVIVPYGGEESPVVTPPTTAQLVTTPVPTAVMAGPSPTPPLVAPISADTVLRLVPVAKLSGLSDEVKSVTFSRDGRYLAAGSQDGSVRIWDMTVDLVTNSTPRHSFQSASSRVISVSFSPDGSLLAAAGHDNLVRLWDLNASLELAPLQGPTGAVNTVAFNPVVAVLAAGSDDGAVYVWDMQASGGRGQLLATLSGHTSYVSNLAFSPDGSLLAAGGEDDTIRLWRWPEGTPVSILVGHTSNVTGVAFSPDGRRLASTSADRTVRLWDLGTLAPTLSESAILQGHTENVNGVTFSPDGSLVVSAAGGIEDNTIRLWSAASGAPLRVLYPDGPANSVVFSPDGSRLATGGATFLALWGASTSAAPAATAPVSASPTPLLAAPGVQDETGCVLVIGLDTVNLRSGPGTSYDLLGTLTAQQRVQAVSWTTGLEEGFTWWQLTNGSWVRGDALANVNTLPDACWALPLYGSPQPTATSPSSVVSPATLSAPEQGGPDDCIVVTILDEVNLRSGPGLDYEATASLPLGQAAAATGWAFDDEGFVWWRLTNGGWLRADTVEWPEICLTLPAAGP